MKKGILKILILVMLLIIASPFNLVSAVGMGQGAGYGTVTEGAERSGQAGNITTTFDPNMVQMTNNIFEKVISDFLITAGDYAHDYLNQTLKEEITIDKIVFNKVILLNANLFENSTNSAVSNMATTVRTVINTWYKLFQGIALVVIMISLILAGMRMMLGTAIEKAGALESGKKIFIASALIFLFPFVMKYAFEINEAILTMIYTGVYNVESPAGIAISPISDLTIEELEERSPQYVSGAGLRLSAGSEEATQMYINKLQQNAGKGDLMRVMRAFAGATLRLVYVIIWYILLIQTYIMVIIYIKRFVVIAFLITVYPIVVVGYVTGSMFGASHNAFNKWTNKFLSNVFLQTLHGVIYGVISGILIDQVRTDMIDSKLQHINWLLMIIATSFLFSGEKILSTFWNAALDTSEREGMKNLLGAPKRLLGKLMGK